MKCGKNEEKICPLYENFRRLKIKNFQSEYQKQKTALNKVYVDNQI